MGLTHALFTLMLIDFTLLSLPAVARIIVTFPEDRMSFNVETDFHASKNDDVDDTQAFQDALDSMANKLGSSNATVSLFIPKGIYKISEPLVFTHTIPTIDNQGIVIRGEGSIAGDGTVIESSAPGGAIQFKIQNKIQTEASPGSYNCLLQIEDIQFLAKNGNFGAAGPRGPAIEVLGSGTNASGADVRPVTPILRNVNIYGSGNGIDSSYFTYGFYGKNLKSPRMANITVWGNPSRTEACVYLDRCYAGLIESSLLQGAKYGYQAVGTSEGNMLLRSNINNVDFGFSVSTPSNGSIGPSPSGGGALNNVITARQRGIELTHKWDFPIGGNKLTIINSGTGVKLDDCHNIIVTDNDITGTVNAQGIVIVNGENDPQWPDHNTIAYNTFNGFNTNQNVVSIGINSYHTKIIDNANLEPLNVTNSGIKTTETYCSQTSPPFTLRSPSICLASEATFPAFGWSALASGFGSNIVNVKDPKFGAKGDGTSVDTTAIQNAVSSLNLMLSTGPGALYFPAGTYLLTGAINLSHPANKKVMIYGDGVGATVIKNVISNSGALLNVVCSGQAQVRIHNLTIKTTKFCDTAIAVKQQNPVPGGTQSLIMHDVKINHSSNQAYFKTAISGSNLVNPLMRHVVITQTSGDSQVGTTGVMLSGGCGFECDHTSVSGALVRTGFDIKTPLGGKVLIRGYTLDHPYDGMKIDAGWGEVHAEGVHANSINRTIDISNASKVMFVKSYTLNKDNVYNLKPTLRASLRLEKSSNVVIRDNLFLLAIANGNNPGDFTDGTFEANTGRSSIFLADADSNNENVEISCNTFGEAGTGISISPNTLDVEIRDNRFLDRVDTSIASSAQLKEVTYKPDRADQSKQE